MDSSTSFSQWLQEAEKKQKQGTDPLATSISTSNSFTIPWFSSFSSPLTAQDVEEGTSLTGMDLTEDLSLSRTERFKWFVTLLAVGFLFFLLSFFFLGLVLVFPGKFAFAFTMGSLSFMSAFVVLQGFQAWVKDVCQKERLPFTLAYFGSIAGTLVATLWLRNYVLIVVCSGVQISALGWYFATYVPGGKHGMKLISATVKGTCKTCFKGCRLCVGL